MISGDPSANPPTTGTIAHIVPGLVPGECGIGDYAVTVAQAMAERGVTSCFLVAGRELAHRSDEYDPRGPFLYSAITGDRQARLVEALSDETITAAVLHYTGYGYEANGVPTWLARALSIARAQRPIRLITFFHEAWERQRLLTRALYRTPLQKRLALRLCRLSDAIITNTNTRAAALAKYHPNGCATMPVFSNIGENDDRMNKEPGLAVTFGLKRRRQGAWAGLAASPLLLDRLGVGTIADIGTPTFEIPTIFEAITTRPGRLGNNEASALMTRASFAFLHYNSDELGKSGAFAAFAAHGLCVVNLGETRAYNPDNLVRGKHFLQAEDIPEEGISMERCSSIATSLSDWYRPHNVESTVSKFLEVLGFINEKPAA